MILDLGSIIDFPIILKSFTQKYLKDVSLKVSFNPQYFFESSPALFKVYKSNVYSYILSNSVATILLCVRAKGFHDSNTISGLHLDLSSIEFYRQGDAPCNPFIKVKESLACETVKKTLTELNKIFGGTYGI